jgi:hypothetical protein
VAAASAGGGVEQRAQETLMKAMTMGRSLGFALLAVALVLPGCAAMKKKPITTAAGEKTFADPKAATDAMLAACRANDEAGLLAIFGPSAKPIISTGNAEADRERCQRLLTAASQMTRFDPVAPNTVQLVVGSDDWPFPIPLVKAGDVWHFDVAQGLQEIRRRRIGADEIEAVDVCREWVQSQAIGGEPLKALDKSPDATADAAWSGYLFRVIQGPPALARRARRTAGALVAYPLVYGVSGVMTFLVGPDGVIYQKDLGPQTAATAAAMTEYSPAGWARVGS